MSQDETDLLLNTVRRDTPKNKITDFISTMSMVFDMISYKSGLHSAGYLVQQQILKYIEYMNYLLILVINCLIMIFFTRKLSYGDSITNPDFDEQHPVMMVMVNVHLVFTCFRLLDFVLFECRLELMKQWRLIYQRIDSKLRLLPNNKDSDLAVLVKQRFVDLTIKDKMRLFRKYNELEGFSTNVDMIDYLF